MLQEKKYNSHSKLATYSKLSIQNIYIQRLWTKKKILCLIYLYTKDSYEAKY